MSRLEIWKKNAALKAVEFVESGMILGLGSGSTAVYALEQIGHDIRSGRVKSIIGIPSSNKTAVIAGQIGIPLEKLDDFPVIDLTIDGADEIDPELNLIKGGGGALLREKILAQNSSRLIIIADETKLSPDLGTKFRLPVEVIPFSLQPMQKYLVSIGAKPTLRVDESGQTFITDEGNFIIDCKFGPISKPYKLAQTLKTRAGLVEHGLFLNLATDVIVAGENGIQHFKASRL